MILLQVTTFRTSMMTVETVVTAISLVLAMFWSGLGNRWFHIAERTLGRLAKRRGLAVASVGLTALGLRLALLPFCPIPQPFAPDDFSFLLGADTFARGHLTNPTPAMWTHFESIHITMVPTYTSMYFPAHALVLAAGQVLFGHPWFGLLLVTSCMCGALCWMLQAWLPPSWALLGGAIAIVRIGLFSCWINTYTGAGSVAALGGALVLGSFPRLIRNLRHRDALLLALGMILLALSRPYEGMLVCLPVAVVLGRELIVRKNRPSHLVLARRAAVPLLLIVAAGVGLGYYDHQAFGKASTLPYTVARNTYAVAPYWIWQSQRPEPAYRHPVLRDFYVRDESRVARRFHTVSGFIIQNLYKPWKAVQFYAGIALLPALLMMGRVMRDRRVRFFWYSALLWAPGVLIVVFLIPHYLAPFTAAFYVVGLQSLRHLRVWKPGGQSVGRGMVRFAVVSCLVLAVVRTYAGPLQLRLADWPGTTWVNNWFGPGPYGDERARVESQLEAMPGRQLVLVRYSADHDPINEWVFNAADIDHAPVIWARDMSPSQNAELLHYYKDRTVWLAEPDTHQIQKNPGQLPLPAVQSPASAATLRRP